MNKQCDMCSGEGLVWGGGMEGEDCPMCRGFGTIYADPRDMLYIATKRHQRAYRALVGAVRSRRWFCFWKSIPKEITEEVTRARIALNAALDAVDALGMYRTMGSGWCSPESAPKDGTPFLWLQVITVAAIGAPNRYEHRVQIVQRKFFTEGSKGHWMGQYISIPDHEFNCGMWQPVNLPTKAQNAPSHSNN